MKKENQQNSLKNITKRMFRTQMVLILTLAMFLGSAGILLNIFFEHQKRDVCQNQKELQCIISHLRSNAETWCTGDEIAGQVGLTSVTVRRYMAYLTDAGIVTGQMNYSTGGRPCMLYKIN